MVFRFNRHLSLVVTSISRCLTILSRCSFSFIPEFTLTSTNDDDNDELIDYTSCAIIYAIIIIIRFYSLRFFCRMSFVFSSLFRSLFIVHCFMYVCMCLMTEEKRNEKPGYVARQNNYYCHTILVNVSGNTNEQTS